VTKVLLTGATGFIGRATVAKLQRSHDVIAPVRTPSTEILHNVRYPLMKDILTFSDTLELLTGVTVVVHIAAKAHIVGVPLSEFRRVNTEATLSLAKNAAKSGVKRFIFLSSIGVNGINTVKPFTSSDLPAPVEDYAISKLEAELGLKKIAVETGMEVTIIRPPLVYGAAAPGNFGKLSQLAQKNWPLPLGAIHNKRSLVALDNLVDLIITCVDHPKAANQIFLVSDDHDVSTTELLKMMILAAGKKPRLTSVPVSWLKFVGMLTGKRAVIDRLCGNLQVDISHTKETLGWTPPISMEEGMLRCFTSCK